MRSPLADYKPSLSVRQIVTPKEAAELTRAVRKCIFADDSAGAIRLINAGANIMAQSALGEMESLLVMTCAWKLNPVSLHLIEHGADINAVNSDGASPLLKCCERGNVLIACLLIERGANIEVETVNGTPLIRSCGQGSEIIALTLLDKGANFKAVAKKTLDTPLILSCSNGMQRVSLRLMDLGADVNAVNNSGDTPLLNCCKQDDEMTALHLIEKGANPSAAEPKTGLTPLMIACTHGNDVVAEKLLRAGADVNAKAVNGSTPLLLSCKAGNNHDIALYLIDAAHADIHAVDNFGYTALLWCCINGMEDIALRLITLGADVNVKETHHGLTPLAAIGTRSPTVWSALLSRGAKE